MNTVPSPFPVDDVFSVTEIADAAGVSLHAAHTRLQTSGLTRVGGFITGPDALALVRALKLDEPSSNVDRAAVTSIEEPSRRSTGGLLASAAAHASAVAVLVLAMTLGLSDASADEPAVERAPTRLVFLATPGPGGGGGGGGLKTPLPVRRAERKAAVKASISSPVPEVRTPPKVVETAPEPPKPIEPAKVEPPPVPPPPAAPAPAVQAPVAPVAADAADARGTVDASATAESQGRGAGGGAGTGSGGGLGEGQGAGIGPGADAGTGGGPYRAGAGIEAPRLRREVKPTYTDAARRRGLEGEVLVEIVVRRDGSVGDVRVIRRLGEGLDAKAVEAVKQWQFAPATRHGVPVDVIVEVSLQFKLR